MKGQPFVRDVGAFTPADYRVKGTVGMGGVQLSTYLFFEAVPDRFLDVTSGKWKYEPGDGDIPIIIPRNYLNLYNYGFAKSQGLPQISEGYFSGFRSASRSPATGGLNSSGAVSSGCRTASIRSSFRSLSSVGRTGGSARAGRNRHRGSSSRPTALWMPRFRLYLDGKGYEAEGDRRDDGKAAYFLQLAAGGLGGWGWCSA